MAPPPAPAPPPTPEEAWAATLEALDPFTRVTVGDNAAFVAFERGVLKLAVRQELWRGKVRDHLRALDLGALFPGFRNVEVVLEGQAGQTGREARSEAEEKRRVEARAAAERSATLKRVLAAFGGQVEAVEPAEGEAVTPAGEDASDE